MKSLFLSLFLLGSVGQASDIVIKSNIYTAAGPGGTDNSFYFLNLDKIRKEVRKFTQTNLGNFDFNSASVNTETKEVLYSFSVVTAYTNDEYCTVKLKFTTINTQVLDSEYKADKVINVKATQDCWYEDQD